MSEHPNRGTCSDPTCPLHGACHCGCGAATSTWRFGTVRTRGYVDGEPVQYLRGHNPGWVHVGIPAERVVSLAGLLIRHHGSVDAAARAAGVAWVTMRKASTGQAKVSPAVARRIVDATLALRDGRRAIAARWDPREPMLPASPVLEQLELDFGSHRQLQLELGERFGVAPRSVARWWARMVSTDRIPLSLADGLATAIGRHPVEIWGATWDALEEAA